MFPLHGNVPKVMHCKQMIEQTKEQIVRMYIEMKWAHAHELQYFVIFQSWYY